MRKVFQSHVFIEVAFLNRILNHLMLIVCVCTLVLSKFFIFVYIVCTYVFAYVTVHICMDVSSQI